MENPCSQLALFGQIENKVIAKSCKCLGSGSILDHQVYGLSIPSVKPWLKGNTLFL
jgi:hypothetical protein